MQTTPRQKRSLGFPLVTLGLGLGLAVAIGSAGLVLAWLAYDQAQVNLLHESQPRITVTAQTEADWDEMGLYIENQGHGPGEIVAFSLALDGEPMDSWADITESLTQVPVQLFPNYSPDARDPTGLLLRATDRVGLYTIPLGFLNVFVVSIIKHLLNDRIGTATTYCSTTGDCWVACRNIPTCVSGPTKWGTNP